MKPIVRPPRKDIFSRIEIERQPIQSKPPRRVESGTWLNYRIIGAEFSSNQNAALNTKISKGCVQSDTGGTCSALVHYRQMQHAQRTSRHCYTLTTALRTA